jgi:uncharacterized phiE125 gp8 family phage protein
MIETLKLKRLTEPQELPLSLAEAKAFLRIDEDLTAADALVMALLRSAVSHMERWTGRALVTQTWRLTLDRWPEQSSILSQDWEGWRQGADLVTRRDFIEIPKPPLQSITTFQVFDTTDAAAAVATTVYFVDTESEPGRVGSRFGQTWPSTTLRPHNGIQITFVAGYGDTWNEVPDAFLQATRLLLAHSYENRAVCDEASAVAIPASAQALLRPYRLWSL